MSCSRARLPRDGSVRPEQLDLPIGAVDPVSAQPGDPPVPPGDPPAPAVDTARALRSLAERFLEDARSKIETLQSVRAPKWLEADLADCETFIREASRLSGLGLDYEGGLQLAEAKQARRELRREREDALRRYRRAAELWRTIGSRVALALRKARGSDPQPLLALAALLEEAGRPLAPADLRTIREARAHLRNAAAERAAGQASAGRESEGARTARGASAGATPFAPGERPGPGAADPDPGLLTSYLPPPAALEFEPEDRGLLERLDQRHYDPPEDYRLNQTAQRLSLLSGFEVLLCPPLLRGVDHYAFQLNTARQVMRTMRGRALLCDEVGLGKTIEAGLVLKEYAIRGLARRVLVLTPPSLVSQWRDEMLDKFAIPFTTLEDPEFRSHGAEAWERCERVIASIHTAKSPKHAERIQRVPYDLIIVDEAHHLRSRASRSWKFVNQLKSKHLLLLTATPAQNDLDELFNLITLLSPGRLKSPADFRREFVERHDPRRPRNRTKLRELLMDVMVRNTRSQVSLRLPPREAATLPIVLTPPERALYDGVTRLVRAGYGRPTDAQGGRMALRTLQAEAGSSAAAVRATLATMMQKSPTADGRAALGALVDLAARVEVSGKAVALVDLMRTRIPPGEKVLVFTQYLETQAFGRSSTARSAPPIKTPRSQHSPATGAS
ncbi:MAG: DEAD/DEAH box helicase [Candidatus Eisenbacteria bacterium]|uniref:DEAD/DEAH box helicase n=1 Tax=Eiseniibacteriota bacterium TaxID=2212470 RepID=A0A538U1X0_UNCEI|nr:MAG: DEAD/DEAH box helicase [Candidatus Eisenbacteria bacterium]